MGHIQDLISPLSQVLQTKVGSATTNYLYGLERLASVSGSTKTWYGTDALGSVRLTMSNAGLPLDTFDYDPWGTPQGAAPETFGFTGELQDASTGLVNLRARWYQPQHGRFDSRDPFAGFDEQPYSLHPYQYAYSNPVLYTDPSGLCPKPVVTSGSVICVDLFISSEKLGFWPVVAEGDGRSFSWASSPAKSRAYVYIYLDSKGRMIRSEGHINKSCIFGPLFTGCYGPYEVPFNQWKVRQNRGNNLIFVDWHNFLNGFSAMLRNYGQGSTQIGSPQCIANLLSYAGPASIDGRLIIGKKGGKYAVGLLDRDHFPSLEVYNYEKGKQPLTMLTRNEHDWGAFWGLNPIAPNEGFSDPSVR